MMMVMMMMMMMMMMNNINITAVDSEHRIARKTEAYTVALCITLSLAYTVYAQLHTT